MSAPGGLPERLRQEIERDARPVRPLPAAWRRLGWVLLWGACIGIGVPAALGMRDNAGALGALLTWGAGLAQGALALWLVYLALREGVPGRGTSREARIVSLLAGAALQTAVGVASWARLGMPGPAPAATGEGMVCVTMEVAFGLPALALTALLVTRAWAVRPHWAGLLGGAGAGLLADAVQHLVCPVADLGHVLLWHGAAVVLLSLAGWSAGSVIARYRDRRREACPTARSGRSSAEG